MLWDEHLEPQAKADGVPEQIIAFLRQRMLSNSPVGLVVMGRYLLACPDRTAELASLGGPPILVLYGENDDAWPPTAQERMARRLGAQRVCIPGAGHSPAVEAPETTASTLNGFWRAAEDAGRRRTAGHATGSGHSGGGAAAEDTAGPGAPDTATPGAQPESWPPGDPATASPVRICAALGPEAASRSPSGEAAFRVPGPSSPVPGPSLAGPGLSSLAPGAASPLPSPSHGRRGSEASLPSGQWAR
jgi:hypothetical protein